MATSPSTEMVQETPYLAGLKSLESVQWRTPATTPSHAWNRRVTYNLPETEEASDEEVMDEYKADLNCPVVLVTKEEKNRLRRPWRRLLIIKVLGRKVSYSYLLQRLEWTWKPESPFELITLDLDYFLAKFESLSNYEFAKFEGPWMLINHYLVVQEWKPNFDPKSDKTEKLLVWVRFPTLPIEYFEDELLIKIART